MIRMKVAKIILDPFTNSPIVVLKDMEERRALPIWIGLFEANAIAMKLEDVVTPRPMTHDLIANILESLKATVERIVVNDLIENTFYARICLSTPEGTMEIDSRPSDAIAIALRTDAPIFVEEVVLEKAKSFDLSDRDQILKEWLENLTPEDLEKFRA
ncbi:bifunctional nuclease family protein [Thermosulfidibacter takaii]|nr:bifunctional nuclease family protein [Thermosulfidibacter takaii]